MDIAGNIFAYKIAKGRAVTVAVDGMVFHKPVYVGYVVSVYSELIKVGHTSISVHVEAWVMRRNEDNLLHVTDGNFTYVAIDDQGHPQAIPQGSLPVSA
jgi:acyl-CoA thioesterase YciA